MKQFKYKFFYSSVTEFEEKIMTAGLIGFRIVSTTTDMSEGDIVVIMEKEISDGTG